MVSGSCSVCENDDQVRFVENIFSTDRPGIGVNILYLFFEGILFFILTLLIEVHVHVCNTCLHVQCIYIQAI